MKVGKEECEETLDWRLGLKGIIFITFLKCGMLREYYFKFEALSCDIEVLPQVYYCLDKWAHKFLFHFFLINQKKINTTIQSDDNSIIKNVGKETKCHSKATLPE